VATVDNIDWPSRPGLSARQQKAELLSILDNAVRLRLNVIILQVRPACDALYDSPIEPWSEYLTGRMGKPPVPYYDPLTFAVAEAHKRGLELHAWINPYRARFRELTTPISRNHVSATHPSLVRTYGKFLWLDPTEQATRDYSLGVIMDVVRRYDIDGVHFDDYFYPYPEKAHGDGPEMDFPDNASWERYKGAGGHLSRNDWRRENVNTFVRMVYDAIKREKPWVKFGISPFGIWQPHHPEGISGFDAYNTLYCDSRKWLENGWLDYIVPQLYWPISQKAQSFATLLGWWEGQNPLHRLLVPGMRINGWKGIDSDSKEAADEILDTRGAGASGEVLWHSKPLFGKHIEVANSMRSGVYQEPALVPSYPWLCSVRHDRPVVTAKSSRHELKLAWREDYPAKVWQWVVRKKTAGVWSTEILPGDQMGETVRATGKQALPDTIVVTAVNRYGNASEPATVNTTSR
jgi:uncharacterized lipoprotein YddW (UPF0748 family)